MARALTVQNAEINTASITIRTLQVEGRQVTMGVFRQLPVEDIIEPQGPHLKGVGWGHVNYQVEGHYSYSGKTIHLVWQKGSELRRCLVHQTRNPAQFSFPPVDRDCTPEAIESYRAQAEKERLRYEQACLQYEVEVKAKQDRLQGDVTGGTKSGSSIAGGKSLYRWVRQAEALNYHLRDPEDYSEDYRRQADDRQKKLDDWRARQKAEWARHQEQEQWTTRRNALVAPLFDLPQLFIAV